jgi:RNA polymerase sigma-70 factor (ECF subfamily)
MDDAELVLQVLQGNLGAYAELVRRYTAQIAALCRAHVSRQEVEDLVQETFLRGLDRLTSLHNPDRFGYWLYAIARNLCVDWHNNHEHQHGVLDADAHLLAAPEPADEDDRADRIAALKQCIGLLPVELREVVGLYYSGGGVTYQKMADRLGVSFGQVNKCLTQARRQLRACLEREGPPTSLPA